MGGCEGGRGRGVCISGIGSCRVGGRSIYSIYSCDVCGWWGLCAVWSICSVFTLCTAVIDCGEFLFIVFTGG